MLLPARSTIWFKRAQDPLVQQAVTLRSGSFREVWIEGIPCAIYGLPAVQAGIGDEEAVHVP